MKIKLCLRFVKTICRKKFWGKRNILAYGYFNEGQGDSEFKELYVKH